MKIYLADTTETIVRTTAELVKNLISSGQKCIVFSEDKITLSLELEIAKSLGGGFFDVDVITFKRYVSSKNTLAKVISKESSVMMVRKIISDMKGELSCFQSALTTPNMAVVLYELISQLESAKITPEDLKSLIDKNEVQTALYNKIKDVYAVYNRYVKEIDNKNLYDGNKYLSLMPELIKNDKEIQNSNIIIAGFQTVTRQRYDIFSALNNSAKGLFAVVPFDKKSSVYTGEAYKELIKIEPNAQIKNVCGNLPEEAEFIKSYFYNPQVFAEDFKPFYTDKVSVYQARDLKDEAEWLAKDVLSEIKRNGLRFSNVSVAVGSLDESLAYITRAFNDYDIPFFVQKTTPLSEHPVCELITSFLDFHRKGYNVKDFIKIISNALFIFDKDVSDGLVNYVYKNMINRKAFTKPFEHSDYENYRKIVMDSTQNLQNAKTVSDFTIAVKNFLNLTCCRENLKVLTERLKNLQQLHLSDVNDRVFEKINSLFDEMNYIMGGCLISALDFKNVFLSGASGTAISSIPVLSDAVYVGECKDVKIKSADILYAVGLNGDVPFTKSDTALLTDGDLRVLDGFDVIIEPKIKAVNLRERENVMMTLCSFTNKLKLSYSVSNAQGFQNFKSDAVKYLISAFGLIPTTELNYKGEIDGFSSEKTALLEIARSYNDYKNGDVKTIDKISSFYDAVERLELTELKEKCDDLLKEKSKERYVDSGENLSVSGGEISASVLESYFSCPYKNYASNVIKLKETPTGEVRVNETGTILHAVTERYVKDVEKVSDKLSSDALVEEIFSVIKENDEYKKYLSSAKLSYRIERLEKECKRVCFNVFNSIKRSKFVPKYYEKRFGRGQDILPIKLNAKSGVIDVKGVVDRVDEYENYVRIIDYKSGKIKSNDESFYTGNKLQLYLYMNAFLQDGKKPAGAYYYPVKDTYSETEESYAMRGKTLSKEDVLIASDSQISQSGKSEIINVTLNKTDGNPSKLSAVLTEEEMQNYIKYAVKVSENCIDEIYSGYCSANPYESACDYCAYGGMCGFSAKEGDKYRKVKKVNAETIVNAVKNSEKTTDKAENKYE